MYICHITQNAITMNLDFTVDALTHSIVLVKTAECFDTDVSLLELPDLKVLIKKCGWKFNWRKEYKENCGGLYKLHIVGSDKIQGCISLESKTDNIYVRLLENAPFNVGQNQLYKGVAGNLMAFACLRSLNEGFDGVVSFDSKSNLIKHYTQSLGAVLLGGQRMAIFENEAAMLINRYYKNR